MSEKYVIGWNAGVFVLFSGIGWVLSTFTHSPPQNAAEACTRFCETNDGILVEMRGNNIDQSIECVCAMIDME